MTKKAKSGTPNAGLSEKGASFESRPHEAPVLPPTQKVFTEIGQGGRIVIPAAMREQMGVAEGTEVMLLCIGEELQVFTPAAGIRRAQRLAKKYIAPGVSLVDELLEDRRREAEEEDRS